MKKVKKKVKAIEFGNFGFADIYIELSKNTPDIDMVLSWKLLWMELMLGREKVDARFVRVLFDGINSMGLFDEKKWKDFSNTKISRRQLSFEKMFELTKDWLLEYDVLVSVKDPDIKARKFEEIINKIPNFKLLLYLIYDMLPLDLNPKLTATNAEEETQLIRFVYGSVEGLYSMTMPDKEKRTFTPSKFNKLVGYLIMNFLCDFSADIGNPDQLGVKVNNAIAKKTSIKHI